MGVAESFMGFILYFSGFMFVLFLLGVLEHLCLTVKRRERYTDQAEQVGQVKFRKAS